MFPEMKNGIYFDNNSTTQLLPEVKEEIINLLNTSIGNPSSPHSLSDNSRNIILKCKLNISKLLGCNSDNIILTSGATESNLSVLLNILNNNTIKRTIVISPSEHASIKGNCEHLLTKGYSLHCLKLDTNGLISLNELENILKSDDTALVSIGWSSSETGVLQPIKEISKLCVKYLVQFHCDASQYVGRGEIDLDSIDIDYLTFTGHKLHAPKGIGCLYLKDKHKFISIFRGGSQENGLRSGTENIIGILGLSIAIEARLNSFKSHIEKIKKIRDYFEDSIKREIQSITINGEKTERSVNTSNITFHGIDGRALLAQLDNEDIYCSQTSACTSMIPEPSETLLAMGLSVDDAFASLRFSFSIGNTFEEVDKACSIIKKKVENIRRFYNYRGVI